MSFSRGLPPSVQQRTILSERKSNTGFIVGIIILVVVVIALIVLVVILWLRRRTTTTTTPTGGGTTGGTTTQCVINSDCNTGQFCLNGVCVNCTQPPSSPSTAAVGYDSLAGSATVSWSAVPGVISYNVYRKLEDPSVGVGNFDQKENTVNTTRLFTGLTVGTHYFVVTALNDCGESQETNPVSLAPICSSIPTTMDPPIVTQNIDNCASPQNAELVDVSFTDENIPNGIYVVQGTGQKGSVSSYLYIVMGDSFGPAGPIFLTCGTVATTHRITQITDVEQATLTVTAPPSTSNTFNMTWKPIAGSERYAVFLVGVDANLVIHYYGGFAAADADSLVLQTNVGDTLVFGSVYGYRICDQSDVSTITNHITP